MLKDIRSSNNNNSSYNSSSNKINDNNYNNNDNDSVITLTIVWDLEETQKDQGYQVKNECKCGAGNTLRNGEADLHRQFYQQWHRGVLKAKAARYCYVHLP